MEPLGLAWGYLCHRAKPLGRTLGDYCATLELSQPMPQPLDYKLWGDWDVLGAAILNHIVGMHPRLLELPCDAFAKKKPLEYNFWGSLGNLVASFGHKPTTQIEVLRQLKLHGRYPHPRANHWNATSGVAQATSKPPWPSSKPLEYNFWGHWGYLGATFNNQTMLLRKVAGEH